MTRFWITLQQGVDFVLSSIEMMRGGEIFVPKIPSTSITDLASLVGPKLDAAQGRHPSRREAARGDVPGGRLHLTLEFNDHYVLKPVDHLLRP